MFDGRATATAMADGDAAKMAAAMVHGNRSNGPGQQQLATVMATATATESELEMATAKAKEIATARATMKEGWPHLWWQCAALFGWATPCLHPMDIRKVHSPALHHGGDTAKSVCSPTKGRVPDS